MKLYFTPEEKQLYENGEILHRVSFAPLKGPYTKQDCHALLFFAVGNKTQSETFAHLICRKVSQIEIWRGAKSHVISVDGIQLPDDEITRLAANNGNKTVVEFLDKYCPLNKTVPWDLQSRFLKGRLYYFGPVRYEFSEN